jgi:hypothetical protein
MNIKSLAFFPEVKIFVRCLEGSLTGIIRHAIKESLDLAMVTLVDSEAEADLVVHDDISRVFEAGEKENRNRWYIFIASEDRSIFPSANVWIFPKDKVLNGSVSSNFVVSLSTQLALRKMRTESLCA